MHVKTESMSHLKTEKVEFETVGENVLVSKGIALEHLPAMFQTVGKIILYQFADDLPFDSYTQFYPLISILRDIFDIFSTPHITNRTRKIFFDAS
jgi:hypothetical protein